MQVYYIRDASLGLHQRRRRSINSFLFKILGILMVVIALVGLARAAGNLDPSFGGGTGKVARSIGAQADLGYAMVIQPDGKIVVAGVSALGPNNNTAVARFNSDGTIDPTFSFGGAVSFVFSPGEDWANAVTLQSDGKIVIAGKATVGNQSQFMVARLTTGGGLDGTFGLDGVMIFPISPANDVANGVAIQNVGGVEKILVTGSVGGPSPHIGLARLNPDGSLDQSFAGGGKVTTVIGSTDLANQVIIQRVNGEDRIVVVGYARFDLPGGSVGQDMALVRYQPNGFLDNTFDGDGRLTVDLNGFDEARTVLVQPVDGQNRLVVGGYSSPAQKNQFTLLRYTEAGVLDTTFGVQGKTVMQVSNHDSQIYALARQSDNKIVAAGIARTGVTGSNSDFGLARYQANGMIDPAFGFCGSVITSSSQGNGAEFFFGVGVTDQGKIVATGFVSSGSTSSFNPDFAVYRYMPNRRAALPSSIDFDGDGRTDIATFRPNGGGWFVSNSCQPARSVQFGANGDQIVPADYDGDGRTDIAVFRQGIWYGLRSSDGAFFATQWGVTGDVPVAGDYDADGKTDVAVYRPANSNWYVLTSRTGQFLSVQFGTAGDKPVPADYDNDGRTNVAVFRPSTGTWYTSTDPATNYGARQFGQAGDAPQTGDFDADGVLDLAVFRPANGTWYLLQSQTGFAATQFGLGTDTPIVGDYDGDTKDDLAVFRSGTWYALTSATGLVTTAWGSAGDIPAGGR